jgi:hypothetical protein
LFQVLFPHCSRSSDDQNAEKPRLFPVFRGLQRHFPWETKFPPDQIQQEGTEEQWEYALESMVYIDRRVGTVLGHGSSSGTWHVLQAGAFAERLFFLQHILSMAY